MLWSKNASRPPTELRMSPSLLYPVHLYSGHFFKLISSHSLAYWILFLKYARCAPALVSVPAMLFGLRCSPPSCLHDWFFFSSGFDLKVTHSERLFWTPNLSSQSTNLLHQPVLILCIILSYDQFLLICDFDVFHQWRSSFPERNFHESRDLLLYIPNSYNSAWCMGGTELLLSNGRELKT